jgi:hypothetical protein
MTHQEISQAVRSILTQHFNIPPDRFSWEEPLEILQQDFKTLKQLMYLEQLLQRQFGDNIQLLENISTAFHTASDVVDLVAREL